MQMARQRRVVLLAVVVFTLLMATSGYTDTTNKRSVSVNVASESDAYVGVGLWPQGQPTVTANDSESTA